MKSWLCALWLACCLCLPALGEEAGDVNLTLMEGDSFQSAALHEGKLYILGYTGLYTWDLAGDQLALAADITDQEAMGRLFSHRGGLYAFNESARQGWRWEAGQFVPAFRLESSWFQGKDEDGQARIRDILSVCYQEERLYLLLSSWNFMDDAKNILLVWNMEENTGAELPAPGVQAIRPARAGQLLAKVAGEGQWALRTATGELGEMLMPPAPWTAGGEAYNPVTGQVCYGDGGLVYTVVGGEAQAAAYLPAAVSLSGGGAFCLPDGRYAYGGRNLLMVRRLYAPGQLPKRQTLKISGRVENDIVTAFGIAYPEISVQADQEGGFGEALRDGLVARDDSFDIYTLSSEFIGDLKAKGYAAVLDDPKLLAEAAKLYPQLLAAITAEEELIAWPMNLQMETWTVDETLWQELKLGDYPQTFDAMFAQLSRWQAEDQEDNPKTAYMESWMGLSTFLELALRQYVLEHETPGEPLSFDDPAFRQALSVILANREALEATASGGAGQPLIYAYNMYKATGNIDSHRVVSLPCPALAEGSPRMTLGRAELLCVNPAGTNQAAAEAFIAFYAAHMAPADKCWLMPGENEPIRPSNLLETQKRLEGLIGQSKAELAEAEPQAQRDLENQLAQREARLKDYMENSYLVSLEDLKIYRELAEHLVFPVNSLFLSGGELSGEAAVQTALNRFVDGEMDSDQFIKELDRVSRMLFGERR